MCCIEPIGPLIKRIHLQLSVNCSEAKDIGARLLRSRSPGDICVGDGRIDGTLHHTTLK